MILTNRICLWYTECWQLDNSVLATVKRLKSTNPLSIKFIYLLAAPEGIEYFCEMHPDVPLYTAAIDSHLDEHGYIIPGLANAGDRLLCTK